MITKFRDGLLLCDATITHPRLAHQTQIAHRVLAMRNVTTILNMSSDELPTQGNIDMYRLLGIHYHHLPIEDVDTKPVPAHLPAKILHIYAAHLSRSSSSYPKKQSAFLVNCSAGINRSALAAAIILWHTPPPELYPPLRTSSDLFAYMRDRQQEHRGLPLLLNPVFSAFLSAYCRDNAPETPPVNLLEQ